MRMPRSQSIVVPLLVLLLAPMLCCRNATGPSQDSAVPPGVWGGTGIRLEVDATGATVEYDCAHGTITERMVIDREGRFDVRGTHVREHGGPVRENEEEVAQPARYAGQVDGGSMTLTVMLPDARQTIGRFTLTRGNQGRIRKCL